MTVEEVIKETKQWPSSQIDQLVKALNNHISAPTQASTIPQISSVAELSRKLDELWEGSNVSYSNEDIVALIRESRGERK